MQKLEAINKFLTGKILTKTVSVFLSNEVYTLAGEWVWDMQSTSVYCSDVISFPSHFEGTIAIIHPDDINQIKDTLICLKNTDEVDLKFRIITTYGQVKKLSGIGLSIIENEIGLSPWQEKVEQIGRQNKVESSLLHAELLTIMDNYTDKINLSGGGYINVQTCETWYSDNVYRIFGLYPQSLNNHFSTFADFLHPEDKPAVIEAFDRSFRLKVPLHLDFRIIAADSKIKYVRVNTYWSHHKSGEEFLFAFIKDDTEQEFFKDHLNKLQTEVLFQNQILQIIEDDLTIGHWYMNLVTRKSFFSESFFKIFGIKQTESPITLNYFIDYIHPDDHQKVITAFNNFVEKQTVTDIQFKILRTDGKIKHLNINANTLVVNNESIIAGIIRDITFIKKAESKLQVHDELNSINELVLQKHEEFNKSGSWLWNLETDQITWSDGIYALLGYKPNSLELDSNLFLNFIIHEDRNMFQENLKLLKSESKESSFYFHLLSRGSKKYIKASFKLINFETVNLFYAVFTDLSQREELQDQANKNSILSTKILQNIKEAITVTDSYNNIIVWNDRSEKIFNKTREEVLSKNLFDVCPYLKVSEVLSGIRSAVFGTFKQFNNLHFSGLTKNVNWHMVSINNPDSKDLMVLHIITELNPELNLDSNTFG